MGNGRHPAKHSNYEFQTGRGLARAHEHIADVEARIVRFLATDFYRIRFEPDQRANRLKIIFDSLHQPDKMVNSVIGDVIGNLRSALDYALVALVAPITGKSEDIGFPFADDVKGFTGQATKSLTVCDRTILGHFINEVQAYDGGKGHSLWVLNKLRNIDKHRFLIAAVHIAGIRASFQDADRNVFTDCTFGQVAGQSGTMIDAPINHIQFTNKPTPLFEVGIDEPAYVPKTSAVTFLNSIASDVKHILDALEVIA